MQEYGRSWQEFQEFLQWDELMNHKKHCPQVFSLDLF